MTRYLFEMPLVLAIFLIVVWTALFIRWRLTRRRGWMLALGLALGLGGIALAVNLLVTTDREIAEGVMNRLVKDVEREGLVAALAYVSPRFDDEHGTTYPGLEKDIQTVSSKLVLSGMQLDDWQVDRTGTDRLDLHFTARGWVAIGGAARAFGPDRWQINLHQEGTDARWKITYAWLVAGHLAGAPQITNFRDLVQAVQSLKNLGWP